MWISFLAWCFVKLGIRGVGERFYCSCQKSGYPTIRLLPVTEDGKERWRCDKCGVWGDVFDAMRDKISGETFDERRDRVEKWKRQFRSESKVHESTFSSVGLEPPNEKIVRWLMCGIPPKEIQEMRESQYESNPRDIGETLTTIKDHLEDLELGEPYALQLLRFINQQCRGHNVSTTDLELYWQQDWEDRVEMAEEAHARTCEDKECTRELCRSRVLDKIIKSMFKN